MASAELKSSYTHHNQAITPSSLISRLYSNTTCLDMRALIKGTDMSRVIMQGGRDCGEANEEDIRCVELQVKYAKEKAPSLIPPRPHIM